MVALAALWAAPALASGAEPQAAEGPHYEPGAIQTSRLHDLRFVAAGSRDGATIAYVLDVDGHVWDLKAEQDLADGIIERIGVATLEFRPKAAAGASQRPSLTEVKLFAKGEPPAWGPALRAKDGQPLSIDLDADLTALAAIVAKHSGLTTVVQAGTHGRVRIVARAAPWEGVLKAALEPAGLGYRIENNIVRIGARDRMATLRALSSARLTGAPISLDFQATNVASIAAIFTDVSGMTVDVRPRPPYEPVTVFSQGAPWDELLDAIVASRGWTHRIEGKRIVVEAGPGSNR